MNRYISLITTITLCASVTTAQNYYYFKGEQIPLSTSNSGNVQPRSSEHEVVYFDQRGMELIPTGYLYVKLKSEADSIILQSLAQARNLEIVQHDEYMPLWYTLNVTTQPKESAIEIANTIFETGNFSAANPDFSFDGLQISYDPDVRKQWNLCNLPSEFDIQISEAWTYASGRGVKIAIIDNGIDAEHVDLQDNIYLTYNCDLPQYPIEIGEHGTHCAGIAAAARNNGLFITGVAPDAKIMAAGMDFDYPASRVIDGLARAINWACNNGADIISCSWSAPINEMISDALDNAILNGRNGKGCVIVCAAGNAITDEFGFILNNEMTFPAIYREEIIAVGATVEAGYVWEYSCKGDNLLVCAPGVNIWSTIPGDEIAPLSGTSMACPHVAGIAALMLERNPTLTADEVRAIIATNANHYSLSDEEREFGKWNPTSGYGSVNAYKIIKNTPKP